MGFRRTAFRKQLAEKLKKNEPNQHNGKEGYTRKERRKAKYDCYLARSL